MTHSDSFLLFLELRDPLEVVLAFELRRLNFPPLLSTLPLTTGVPAFDLVTSQPEADNISENTTSPDAVSGNPSSKRSLHIIAVVIYLLIGLLTLVMLICCITLIVKHTCQDHSRTAPGQPITHAPSMGLSDQSSYVLDVVRQIEAREAQQRLLQQQQMIQPAAQTPTPPHTSLEPPPTYSDTQTSHPPTAPRNEAPPSYSQISVRAAHHT